MLDLRGTVVPVIDLRRLFGLPSGFDGLTVTVVLGVGGQTVGAVADAVADVVALRAEDISPVPGMPAQGAARHINGLGMVR